MTVRNASGDVAATETSSTGVLKKNASIDMSVRNDSTRSVSKEW